MFAGIWLPASGQRPILMQRHTGQLRDGMHSFALPFAAPTFTVSLMWHPRMEGDAAHRWLRGCVRAVCAASL